MVAISVYSAVAHKLIYCNFDVDRLLRRSTRRPLPAYVDALKRRANAVHEKQKYDAAIMLYNEAILLAPDSPVLYGNRAAAFMKRNWSVTCCFTPGALL